MKARPILFSAPMVRAALDGRKTQTRRIAQPKRSIEPMTDECPYGEPGGRLWVRESFSGPHHQERHPPRDWHRTDQIHYWADGDPEGGDWTRPRPGMFMPRWASRITLLITDVRVERLQNISRGEAMAEGCPFQNMAHEEDPRAWFENLWRDLNGDASWHSNPWVWVIEFKRIEAAK